MTLKETIIHESLKLFSLKGFLSTSIHDILVAAETSKGGLYNHFRSKEDLFLAVLQEGRAALVKDSRYLALFGIQADVLSVGELWRVLANRLLARNDEAWAPLKVILDVGPLARRILSALGPEPDRDQLAAVYRELCDCLQEGRMYHV